MIYNEFIARVLKESGYKHINVAEFPTNVEKEFIGVWEKIIDPQGRKITIDYVIFANNEYQILILFTRDSLDVSCVINGEGTTSIENTELYAKNVYASCNVNDK